MNDFSVLFLIFLIGTLLLKFWLNLRQMRFVAANRGAVPAAFAASIPLTAHQKAADYTLAKTRLANLQMLISTGLLLLLTFGGWLQALAEVSFGLFDSQLLAGAGFIFLVLLLSHLVELPLALYLTFRIEERFGFNRSSYHQFFKDQALQMLVSTLIGAPLLLVMLWLMHTGGSLWWLTAWGVFIAFSLFMSWAYPIWLAPLFNDFTPLQDEALKSRIQSLLTRCGFENDGIFVMDGSRRSGHGNAYFTGMGKNKRIVFFDTLLDALEPHEIEAVLAHELGHFKCHHVRKQLMASTILSLFGFACLGWLTRQEWFYQGLGVQLIDPATALMLFMLITPMVLVLIKPLMSAAQRKFEFEADRFASTHAEARSLIEALVKLYRENASTLTPDPVYSGFHHSHPPASIRIAHLERHAQPAAS